MLNHRKNYILDMYLKLGYHLHGYQPGDVILLENNSHLSKLHIKKGIPSQEILLIGITGQMPC